MFRSGWKVFGAIGSAVGAASQYKSGYEGKSFTWEDMGPQVAPKLAGRLHYGHNQQKQMEGRWEMESHRAKLMAETPPFTTNYPNRPFIKY